MNRRRSAQIEMHGDLLAFGKSRTPLRNRTQKRAASYFILPHHPPGHGSHAHEPPRGRQKKTHDEPQPGPASAIAATFGASRPRPTSCRRSGRDWAFQDPEAAGLARRRGFTRRARCSAAGDDRNRNVVGGRLSSTASRVWRRAAHLLTIPVAEKHGCSGKCCCSPSPAPRLPPDRPPGAERRR